MKQVDEERFSALLAWATAHGGSLHPALEVYQDDVAGFSMRVKPNLTSEGTHVGLSPQDEILSCPLTTSLSYLNTLQDGPILLTHHGEHASGQDHAESTTTIPSPAFPPEFMALPPHVISRFYLIKQYLLGTSSFWYPYIATLPQPDALRSWNLPPFWPETDTCLLEGTNTGTAAEEIRNTVKAEYKQARRILQNAGFENWQDYTRSLHTWAFSMFTSRSFRPSLVIPKTVWDVVEKHMPSGVKRDDFSLLLPVFDIINHSTRAQVQWRIDHDQATACRFQTLDTYHQPGQQIFNSYGSKTNSELLLSYGFFLPETEDFHNDYLHLRLKAPSSSSSSQPQQGATGNALSPGLLNSGGSENSNKPQDYLVSLRPMNHPSSVAGNRRQLVAKDANVDIQPEFAHVEDALIWDLCLMVVGEENKPSFVNRILAAAGAAAAVTQPLQSSSDPDADVDPPTALSHTQAQQDAELECLRRLLSASASQGLPPEVAQVVAQVKEILMGKLGREYDKLCATDPSVGVDEHGNEIEVEVVPRTSNQELAIAYRRQSKKVLENAIAAMIPDWEPESADEEG